MKSKILASAFFAQFLFMNDALAGCYWQWEGIKSRFICEEDEGSGSCLSMYSVNKAAIYNNLSYQVNFSVSCGGGYPRNYSLQPGYYQQLSCPSSNTCVSAEMLINFDSSTRSGYQEKEYSIGNYDREIDYKFLSRGSNIDLYVK